MCGCYEALEGGRTDEALAALTGFPCERLELQPPAQASRRSSAAMARDGEAFDLDVQWTRLMSFHEAGE